MFGEMDGDNFNHIEEMQPKTKSSSRSITNSTSALSNGHTTKISSKNQIGQTPTMNNAEELQNGPGKNKALPGQAHEHEQHLPVANVVRIMRKGLPPHAKVGEETKEMMQECVSEFISFITSEANEKCQKEHRKTVIAEDLIGAMARLGFEHYVEPLFIYLQKYRSEVFPMPTKFHLPQCSNTPPGYMPSFGGPNMNQPQYSMYGYAGPGPISGTGCMGQESVNGGNGPTSEARIMSPDFAGISAHGGNNPGLGLANGGGSSSKPPPAKNAFYDPYGQYE